LAFLVVVEVLFVGGATTRQRTQHGRVLVEIMAAPALDDLVTALGVHPEDLTAPAREVAMTLPMPSSGP